MKWFFPKGDLAKDGWDVLVNGEIDGWQHTGTRVGTFGEGRRFHIPADDVERLIWPLEGLGLTVSYRLAGESEFQTQQLDGRQSVFHGPSDLIYLPMETEVFIEGDGRVIIAEAPARELKPVKFIPKSEVPVVLRGAGRETRQVHNFGVPDHLDASRFIVVEVIVPAGNWSGAPPHKHDTYIPGVESNLEEVYYFESAVERNLTPPAAYDATGYMRGVTADSERPYDQLDEVRSGDVSLVPNGWHGPVMAAPGYDLYFMNVMAGPDPDRSWNITDDPNHAWIRETWHHQAPDPRLPYQA
jgi:5-deoxy-glucuronate isomerase